MKTINVSLTDQQLDVLQNQVKNGMFASISEAIRDAIRSQFMQPTLTENGFTPEEEAALLKQINDPSNTVIEFPASMSIEEQLDAILDGKI